MSTNNVTHNISKFNHYDDFVCSSCGIILSDWVQSEYEYDENYNVKQVKHPKCKFKYCPNCGKKMVNEEFETRKKEIAGNLQLLLDEMRQLHDWIVLNPVTEITQKNYKDWKDSFDALHSSFKILGHKF